MRASRTAQTPISIFTLEEKENLLKDKIADAAAPPSSPLLKKRGEGGAGELASESEKGERPSRRMRSAKEGEEANPATAAEISSSNVNSPAACSRPPILASNLHCDCGKPYPVVVNRNFVKDFLMLPSLGAVSMLIYRGHLKPVKIGRKTLIRFADLIALTKGDR